MHFNKKIIKQFVTEAKEYLGTIGSDLAHLRESPGKLDTAAVDKVFRAHHTIKEGAGFLGLKNITALALLMENMLTMIRAREIKPGAAIISALSAGADRLNDLLDHIEHSNEMDISTVYSRLADLISGEVSARVKKELDTDIFLYDARGKNTGFNINEYTRKNLAAKGKLLYILKYDLMALTGDKQQTPLRLVRHLQKKGSIIEGKLLSVLEDLHAGLPRQPLIYEVLYATTLRLEQLKNFTAPAGNAAAGVGNRAIKEIQPVDDDASLSRDPGQGTKLPNSSFIVFRDYILPGICERSAAWKPQPGNHSTPKSRVWSIGAPAGVEAYLIAALVHEYIAADGSAGISAADFSILSTDESPAALARTILGEYEHNEIEANAPPWPGQKSQYFSSTGASLSIRDHIRSMVTFRQIDLTASFSLPAGFDVIFCFNSFAAFDRGTVKKIFKRLFSLLAPGGVFLPRPSEGSPGIGTGFTPLKYGETTIYKRAASGLTNFRKELLKDGKQ